MRVLLIGQGAREHALACKLQESSLLTKLYCWPPNEFLEEFSGAENIGPCDTYEELAKLSSQKTVDLMICGPETPLAEGVSDIFQKRKIKVFAPSKQASYLESSKSFAKKIMQDAQIPTAKFEVFEDLDQAYAYAKLLMTKKGACVVKADGLAAGKGVFVCHTKEQIFTAMSRLKQDFVSKVLVEECLVGREFSYFSLLCGNSHLPLGYAVDFKRIGEGDKGLNTGGMGAYSPVPWISKKDEHSIYEKIVDPLLHHLHKIGLHYQGFLYCGLIHTEEGIKVIEFNVRMGDPETQVLVVHDSRDWLECILSSFEKKQSFNDQVMPTKAKTVGFVLSSQDYPMIKESVKVHPEHYIPSSLFKHKDQNLQCFAASISYKDQIIRPKKGRVLTIVAKSEQSFSQSRSLALEKAHEISKTWQDAYWRKDIAQKVSLENP